jgi:hypothetical protein
MAKLLGNVPVKSIGPVSLGPLLGTLKLIVAVDQEALARIHARLTKRKHRRRQYADTTELTQRGTLRRRFLAFKGNLEIARLMRQRGILKTTPKQRSAIARKAAKARWRRPVVVQQGVSQP